MLASLASCWVGTGALYHLIFFRQNNPAAAPLGALFTVRYLAHLDRHEEAS